LLEHSRSSHQDPTAHLHGLLQPLSAAAAIRYEAVEAQAEALERPYQGLAALLNCERDEVALLQSATAAWTQARPGPPCAAMPLGLRALRGGGRAWAVCARRRGLGRCCARALHAGARALHAGARALHAGVRALHAGNHRGVVSTRPQADPGPRSCRACHGNRHGACARSTPARVSVLSVAAPDPHAGFSPVVQAVSGALAGRAVGALWARAPAPKMSAGAVRERARPARRSSTACGCARATAS